jgi:hypothetical protein
MKMTCAIRVSRGQMIVEFILAFPVFLMLVFGAMDFVAMGIEKIVLESRCRSWARRLAMSALQSPDQMEERVAGGLPASLRSATEIEVQLRFLPVLPDSQPLRRSKEVQILSLTLRERIRPRFPLVRELMTNIPFTLTVCCQEGRVIGR